MKKVLFVINPKSGKGTIRTKLMQVLDIFTKAEFDTTVTGAEGSCNFLQEFRFKSLNFIQKNRLKILDKFGRDC